jgi:potassium-transporting ATPase KdpC subunit
VDDKGMIKRELQISLRAAVVTLLLTGIAYPLALTGAALLLFPNRARGSLVADERGRVVGSELIAQPFSGAGYLQPRPSAAGEKGYDATSSGGSNLGPTSKALRERVTKDVERLLAENPEADGPVPAELVTTSGSGLDPHLSPAAALWQLPRVARARAVDPARIRAVIDANVEGRDLAVLGEPRVNVLLVNLALDRHFGRPRSLAGR